MNRRNDPLLPQEYESVLSVLTDLIAIPSVKDEATQAAPYGEQTLLALEYMLKLGALHGFSVKNLDGRAGYIEWGEGDKMLGLLCHLDVVPAGEGWSQDPFTLRKENGRLIGRGVVDDKGPAVACFFAMLQLKKQGFHAPCRIRLILGLDEECGSSCMEHYIKVEELPTCGFTPDADFPVIFAEKGILQLRISGKASLLTRMSAGERPNMVPARCRISWLDSNSSIDVSGIPAHAAKPHLGKNAIYEALSQTDISYISREPLLRFFMTYIGNDTTGKDLLSKHHEDLSGSLTLNAGVADMNDQTSELILDIRYPISSDAENIQNDIMQKAATLGLTVSVYSHQKPLFRDPEDPLIRTLLSVYEKNMDHAPVDEGSDLIRHTAALQQPVLPISIGGGTYARTMPGFVAFGPSLPWEKDQAHQINESLNEDAFHFIIHVYKDAIIALSKNIDTF